MFSILNICYIRLSTTAWRALLTLYPSSLVVQLYALICVPDIVTSLYEISTATPTEADPALVALAIKSNSRVLIAVLQDDKPQLFISTLAGSSIGHSDLPPEINQLAATFPHGPPEVPIYDLQDLISGYLPPWERAEQLRDLYLEQAPWFFGAVTQRQLFEEIFPLFYEQARSQLFASGSRGQFGASAEAFSLQQTGTGLPHASSHELALMFVVFCFGALTDPDLPPAPHNEEAARYYQLTRAALSLEPVMDRPPSVATVQVLSLMGIYMVRLPATTVSGRTINHRRVGHGRGRSQHRVHLVSNGFGFETRTKRESSVVFILGRRTLT